MKSQGIIRFFDQMHNEEAVPFFPKIYEDDFSKMYKTMSTIHLLEKFIRNFQTSLNELLTLPSIDTFDFDSYYEEKDMRILTVIIKRLKYLSAKQR